MDPNANNNNSGGGGANGPDIANATASADGNIYTISSFKAGLGAFSMIENASPNAIAASSANATATLDTDAAHATEGTNSVDVNFIALAANALGLKVDPDLSDWTPYRYVHFDVKTGASAFNGKIVVLSKADWSGWCEASGSVPANDKGTLTLDMNTCSAAQLDKTLVKRLQLQIDTGTTAGHFYVDYVRLEKATPTPSGTDVANLTPDATGNGITLTGFKDGLNGLYVVENKGGTPAPTAATVALDSGSHGSEGSNSVAFTIVAQPSPAGNYVEAAIDPAAASGNFGVADWGKYRYLSFDVTTGATAFTGLAALQTSSGWTWCPSADQTVAATSKGTVVLDMTTCSGAVFTDVKRFALGIKSPSGTFYIDNIRLYGTPPAPATDLNDGANTAGVYTLTSFKNGLGSWKGMDDQGAQAAAASSATGTVTLDTVATNATDGTNSAAVTVSTNPIKNAAGNHAGYGVALDSNGPLADWTGYRYIKADIVTGGSPFNGVIAVQSNAWGNFCNSTWTWIPANTAKTTLVLDLQDLTKCQGSLTVLNAVNRIHILSDQLGTFNVDNVRLDGYTAPPAADAADGASSVSATDGNVITLASFKTNLGSWKGMDDQGGQAAAASSATGTVTLDTVATNATDGTNSAAVTVSTNPVKNAAGNHAGYGVALDSNGPLADWTGYRYIKADIVTGGSPFNGVIAVQSNAWGNFCNSTWTWIPANTAKTTLVLDLQDLTKCQGSLTVLNAVNRIHILSDQLGTFNVDNIRLTTQ